MLAVKKCLESSAARRCLFIDPRKKKDWKRGVIKGSVLYTYKTSKDFRTETFFAALQKKGYLVHNFGELRDMDIISGCNGKFCPRSHACLSFLIEQIGADNIDKQNLRFFWARENGVPGILRAMKTTVGTN